MDFINDRSGRHLTRLATLTEAPDFVKQSSLLEEDTAKLSSHQFADNSKRLHPIDTPGHVWISYGYCKSASVENPYVLNRIKLAGEKFDIKDSLEALDTLFSDLEKSASGPEEPSQCAVYINFGTENVNGHTGVKGFYPIDTVANLEKSAVALATHREKLPLESFVEGARNIVKRASELGVSDGQIPPSIKHYGTSRLPDFDTVNNAAQSRYKSTGDEIYLEIAKTASANPEGRSFQDYAELWRKADVNNDVVYSRSTVNPYRIFNSGVPEAYRDEQIEKWAMLSGAPVPVQAVSEFSEKKANQFFRKDTADKIIEIVKKASNLPGSAVTELLESLDTTVQKQFLKLLIQ